MTYKLTATVNHKSFHEPIVHTFMYEGNSIQEVLSQIDTLPKHLHNLKKHGRTTFKDTNGVNHSWTLSQVLDSAS